MKIKHNAKHNATRGKTSHNPGVISDWLKCLRGLPGGDILTDYTSQLSFRDWEEESQGA